MNTGAGSCAESGVQREFGEFQRDAPAESVETLAHARAPQLPGHSPESRRGAAVERQEEDRDFIAALTGAILQRYPGCPADEAGRIAEHTGCRSSGRVGRSAAGRALDATAVDLAVIAHIRHSHTNYDELLMGGTARLDSRALVREKITDVLAEWSCAKDSEG